MSVIFSPQHGTMIDRINPINRLHPLARGLYSWRLCVPGDMSGKYWVDLASLTNVGTLTNMANPGTLASGRAAGGTGHWGSIAFDGSDDVVIPTVTPGFNSWTLAVSVFQISAFTSYRTIFGVSGNSWYLKDQKSTYFAAADRAATNVIPANTWTNLALVHNNLSLAHYTNGIPNGSNALPGAITLQTGNRIGALDTGGFPFTGRMDNFKLYNRPLTDTEVLQLHTEDQLMWPGLLRRVRANKVYFVPEAPGGLSIPIAAHHYRQMAGV